MLSPQTQPSNYRKVLREIKSKEIFNIIVDTSKEHIHLFFRTLLQLQMNNDKVICRYEESAAFEFNVISVPLHFHFI